MRIAHLADLHLGFRQYQRLTGAGFNQREADVAASFKRAIDATIALRPDVVLIAGDVFHAVRPSNPAILHAFTQFARLRETLPDADVVMVAGNHDTPRTAETGCILRLFSPLGVHVVEGEPRRVEIPERELSILCVPDIPGALPALTPDRDVRHNVLLLHGEVAGMLPDAAQHAERASVEITPEQLGAEQWDYVALGHYHVFREVAPNACYAGSIDYTSANPWGEMREEREAGIYDARRGGKGLVVFDFADRRPVFHPLPVARPFIDLPRIDGTELDPAAIDAAIQDRADRSRELFDDCVVRLVITNVPRHVARQLDQRPLRELKRRALHFHLDIRRPELVRRSVSGAPGRRPSLSEVLRDKLTARRLPREVERDAFVARGMEYLDRADAEQALIGLVEGSA